MSSVSYQYDDSISADDRSMVESVVPLTKEYFQRQFGRTINKSITVRLRAIDGGVTGTGGGSSLTIYTLNEGWIIVGRTQKSKIIAHELFHILQGEVAGFFDLAAWFSEGSAEYVGYGMVVEAGMTSSEAVKVCQTDNYFGADGPSAPPLEHLSDATSPVRGFYLIAWLAIDRLLNGPTGIPRLRGYWEATGASDLRFQVAFGVLLTDFYRDFAQYRTTVRGSGTNSCAALNRT